MARADESHARGVTRPLAPAAKLIHPVPVDGEADVGDPGSGGFAAVLGLRPGGAGRQPVV